MSINYVILKSSIINSTMWDEDAETCKVWITMLAMRNKSGEIFSSLPGLAHASRISLKKTTESVQKFLRKEKLSSSRDDGRRIEEIPGGWKLLNHAKIQAEAKVASKAAYMKDYMAEQRAKEKNKLGDDCSEKLAQLVANGDAVADAAAADERSQELSNPTEELK